MHSCGTSEFRKHAYNLNLLLQTPNRGDAGVLPAQYSKSLGGEATPVSPSFSKVGAPAPGGGSAYADVPELTDAHQLWQTEVGACSPGLHPQHAFIMTRGDALRTHTSLKPKVHRTTLRLHERHSECSVFFLLF